MFGRNKKKVPNIFFVSLSKIEINYNINTKHVSISVFLNLFRQISQMTKAARHLFNI